MHARIVTFGLGVDEAEYRAMAEAVAPAFRDWPGLLTKVWIHDPGTGTYGGIYVFDSAEAAERSTGTELFQQMVANPAFVGLQVRELSVLEAPTAVTAGVLRAAA